MNYKDFNLGDWIGHISGVIEDESELDGNEMRDLLEFLITLNPCDDCVSRQAVNEIINDIRDCISVAGYCAILERLKKLPPINPQKSGKWIEYDDERERYDEIECSECGRNFTVDAYRWCDIGFTKDDLNFCPNCGADMRGEQNG